MKLVVFILSVAGLAINCEGRQLNRCEIVRELRSHGFPENQLRDWVCLIEKESSGKTHKVSGVNKNGSRDHGLFQINDKYWCSSTGSPGKNCKVTCEDVTTEDITKAAACAKKVYSRHGFGGWYGWLDFCQGSLPDISSC